ADFGVPPHALDQIVLEIIRPKYLGHGAVGAAIVFEQFLEPIFRLRVTDRISRSLERGRKNMWNPKLIPIECRLIGLTGRSLRQPGHRQNERQGKSDQRFFHSSIPSSRRWLADFFKKVV